MKNLEKIGVRVSLFLIGISYYLHLLARRIPALLTNGNEQFYVTVTNGCMGGLFVSVAALLILGGLLILDSKQKSGGKEQ